MTSRHGVRDAVDGLFRPSLDASRCEAGIGGSGHGVGVPGSMRADGPWRRITTAGRAWAHERTGSHHARSWQRAERKAGSVRRASRCRRCPCRRCLSFHALVISADGR